MLQDVVQPPEQQQLNAFVKDELSSPLNSQLFCFCDPDPFPGETFTTSEVASCSNCCQEENSSYSTNLSFPQDIKFSTTNCSYDETTTSTYTPINTATRTAALADVATNNNSNLQLIFDSQDNLDNDLSASIDFSSFIPENQQDQYDNFSSLVHPPMPVNNGIMSSQYLPETILPHVAPPLPPVLKEDCLSTLPPFLRVDPSSTSCSFLNHSSLPSYLPTNIGSSSALPGPAYSGIFSGGKCLIGSDLQQQELDYQGDNSILFFPDSLQQILDSGELQSFCNESAQQLMNNGEATCSIGPLASEISCLEESSFKVGKLSVEQRKEKIHRYMKKRNERNFSKKIKYACRKTLADSRPRVRGRFAKNEEFGENSRPGYSNHEDDDDSEVILKEEEDIMQSADVFAHINGVNSFKCSYPIQSWI